MKSFIRGIGVFLFMAATGYFLAGTQLVASPRASEYCQCYNFQCSYCCDICGAQDCVGPYCCAYGYCNSP